MPIVIVWFRNIKVRIIFLFVVRQSIKLGTWQHIALCWMCLITMAGGTLLKHLELWTPIMLLLSLVLGKIRSGHRNEEVLCWMAPHHNNTCLECPVVDTLVLVSWCSAPVQQAAPHMSGHCLVPLSCGVIVYNLDTIQSVPHTKYTSHCYSDIRIKLYSFTLEWLNWFVPSMNLLSIDKML